MQDLYPQQFYIFTVEVVTSGPDFFARRLKPPPRSPPPLSKTLNPKHKQHAGKLWQLGRRILVGTFGLRLRISSVNVGGT